MDTARSYGWSVMSAAGAGWHITGFEKLVLGWDDLKDYIFLKRGIIPTDHLVAQGEKGKKGIIILPDADAKRDDIYFIEMAQEIGVGEAKKEQFNTNNKVKDKDEYDYGLLVMMARQDRQYGVISPFVCERPTNVIAAEKEYGGASQAPFKQEWKFTTNGIFSYQTPKYSAEGLTVSRIVGVDGTYSPPTQAVKLRENERIVKGDQQFGLTPIGTLAFAEAPHFKEAPCLNLNGEPIAASIGDFKLYHTDYGYCTFVDGKGVFHLAKALDDKPQEDAVLKKFDVAPADIDLPDGKYFFKIEEREGVTYVSVYQEVDDGEPVRKYDLFRKPQITRGWRSGNGKIPKIVVGEDGNVVVLDAADSFKGGSYQVNGEQISAITFSDKGKMKWLDRIGKVLRTFSGKEGVGPFTLDVNDNGDRSYDFFVKDKSNDTRLYTVWGHRFERSWRSEGEKYTATVGDDGNVVVLKDGIFRGGSVQVYGGATGYITKISFDHWGKMFWEDAKGNNIRTFKGKREEGPFTLDVVTDAENPKGWNLVVKNTPGTTLYPVWGHRFERNWEMEEGKYKISFGENDGVLAVSKDKKTLMDSGQLYGDDGKPTHITFAETGEMKWWHNKKVLKTFSGKEGKGPFTFVLDNVKDYSWDLVVKDITGKSLYTIYSYVDRHWESQDDTMSIKVNDDGNVSVLEGETFLTGSRQVYGSNNGHPTHISFSHKGEMKWWNDKKVLKTFSGKDGEGPFKLALDNVQKHSWDLVVKDAKGVTLYTVYSYIKRGWNTKDGDFKIAFGDDGNIGVSKSDFLTGSQQVYGIKPDYIALTHNGEMKWYAGKIDPIKTFSGKEGEGPFNLGINKIGDHYWDLVVKDAKAATLYTVYSYIKRGWQIKDGLYTISLDSDGDLKVYEGEVFRGGTYQRLPWLPGRSSVNATIFTDNGTMFLVDAAGTKLKTLSGAAGKGPFTLTVVPHPETHGTLVVKDANGTKLYEVFNCFGK